MEAGEGYRLLEVGEPIEAGDENLHYGKWHKTIKQPGEAQAYGATYRRKVVSDPGEGWVWLEPGEEVAPGDECRCASDPDDDWVMVQRIGSQAHGLVYRSKYKEPEPVRAFEVGDRVRVVKKDSDWDAWESGMDSAVGQIGSVRSVSARVEHVGVTVGGEYWAFRPQVLELVTEPEPDTCVSPAPQTVKGFSLINTDHLTYCHGTAIQVLLRSARESDPVSSLREARDLIEREIARLGR